MPLHMALPGSVTLSSDSDSGTSAGAVKSSMPLLPAMKPEDFNNAHEDLQWGSRSTATALVL